METDTAPGSSGRLTEGLPERRFRPELHGLRGLAILLVALFHVFGHGRVSGGLDVFLVVSGFLFTGMLLREAATTGRIRVGPYIGRLARRLLPAMVTVVAVTTVAGLLVLPESRWNALLREAAASVLYVENWELIKSQLAYEAAGADTSVFQHIWSLSVQGQFYLLWPVLTIVAVVVARRLGMRARTAMIVVSVLVMAASFPFAVYMHHAQQSNAYLNTGTRLWQLAFGALIALLGAEVLPRAIRPVTGWIGLLLIITCGFFLDGGQLFPGPWALWPVLGFALVMWSEHDARWGVTRVLQLRPFAWVGDISYAFYLWHWPILVLWISHSGHERVGLLEAVGILALAITLAQLTLRLVERPVTARLGSRPGPAMALGAALVVLVAAPTALGAQAITRHEQDELARQESLTRVAAEDKVLGSADKPLVLDNPGARDLDPDSWVDAAPDAELIPELGVLEKDQPDYYDKPCRQQADGPGTETPLICDDPDHPEGSPGWEEMPVVVVAGGSHAGQWVPAFEELGRQHGWRILVADKGGCQLTSNHGQYPRPRDITPRSSCVAWNKEIVDVLDDLDPDLVVTIGTTSLGAPESTSRGFLDKWAELEERDIPVLTMRDSPRIRKPLSECLSRTDDPSDCDTPRVGSKNYGLAATSPFVGLEGTDGIGYVDLSEYYCPKDTCPAVVGNVIVYRDASHLSSTFVRTLAAPLSRELREQAPQLYE